LGDLFAEDADFLLLDLAGLLGGSTSFQGILDFVRLSGRKRIKLTDPPVSLRNGLLQLLDRAAMDSFPIAQFDLQLMHTILHRSQPLYFSAQSVPIGKTFIELGNMISQNSDFLLQDFLGLLSRSTGLLRFVEFVRLNGSIRIKLADPTVAFRKQLFELLKGSPMGRFPITQLDLQLMDTGLCRFQLLDLGPKSVSAGQVLIELGDLVSQHPVFLFQYLLSVSSCLTSLLSPTEFIQLSNRTRIELTDPPIALRKQLFELLDRSTMSRLPITQFDLQLMHTILHRGQLLQMGTEAIPIGEVLIELGNLVTQNPDFLFKYLLGVFGGLTSLLSPAKLIYSGGHVAIEFTNPVVAINQRLFELLERPSMSRFSITQLDL